MADLMFPNIVGSYNQGFDRGQALQANQLAGKLIASQGNDTASRDQLAAINPGMEQSLTNSITDQQDQHMAKLAGAARYVLSAVQSGNPTQIQGAYNAVKPFLAQFGTPPDQYTPDMEAKLHEIIAQAGGTPYESPKVLTPGSELIGTGGAVLHSTPFADKIINNVPVGPNGEKGLVAINPGAHGAGGIVQLGNMGGGAANSPAFFDSVNDLAGKYGATITSGVRSPEHNAEVGGVPNSQHLTGTAADVVIPPDQKQAFIDDAKARGLQPIDEGDHVHLQNPNGGAGVSGVRLAIGAPATKVNSWEQRLKAADLVGATPEQKKAMVLGASGMANATASDLTPDALTNATFDYLFNKTLPPVGRGGQGQAQRTAIMNNAADVAKALNMSPSDFATRAGQQKALQGSLNAYQKRADAMEGQEQSFLRNLSYAQSISDQIERSGSPALNKWILGGRENLGDPEVVKLQNALTPVASDYARIMSGSTGAGGTPVSTQQEALEMLRKELSQKQFNAAADVLRNDISNQRLGVADQMKVIQDRMRGLGTGGIGGALPANAGHAPETVVTPATSGAQDFSHLWGGG